MSEFLSADIQVNLGALGEFLTGSGQGLFEEFPRPVEFLLPEVLNARLIELELLGSLGINKSFLGLRTGGHGLEPLPRRSAPNPPDTCS